MNEKTTGSHESAFSSIVVKKEIVPFTQEGPVEEPLFINYGQVGYHEGIVYIDVGVIPLDEIRSPEKAGEVRFIVLNRLVMGLPTLENLSSQIANLMAQLGEHDAATQTSDSVGTTSTPATK